MERCLPCKQLEWPVCLAGDSAVCLFWPKAGLLVELPLESDEPGAFGKVIPRGAWGWSYTGRQVRFGLLVNPGRCHVCLCSGHSSGRWGWVGEVKGPRGLVTEAAAAPGRPQGDDPSSHHRAEAGITTKSKFLLFSSFFSSKINWRFDRFLLYNFRHTCLA